MKKAIQIVSLAAILMMLVSTGALADGPGKDSRVDPSQLSELQAQAARRIAADQAELAVIRSEIRDLWRAEKPDRMAILAKEAKAEQLRQKVSQARLEHCLTVLKTLTANRVSKVAMSRQGVVI